MIFTLFISKASYSSHPTHNQISVRLKGCLQTNVVPKKQVCLKLAETVSSHHEKVSNVSLVQFMVRGKKLSLLQTPFCLFIFGSAKSFRTKIFHLFNEVVSKEMVFPSTSSPKTHPCFPQTAELYC